jgi:hypothetical protein
MRMSGERFRTGLHRENTVCTHAICWGIFASNADHAAGEKARQQREDAERSAENESKAGGSYAAVKPDDLDRNDESGLPVCTTTANVTGT